MAYTPRSAKDAKVRINGNTFVSQQYDVDESVDEIDTSSAEDNGYGDLIGNLSRATVTVQGMMDAGNNPFDTPLDITPGTTLTNVKLYISGTSLAYWDFPSVLVVSVRHGANVRSGGHTINWTFKSKGQYSEPTGNF